MSQYSTRPLAGGRMSFDQLRGELNTGIPKLPVFASAPVYLVRWGFKGVQKCETQ